MVDYREPLVKQLWFDFVRRVAPWYPCGCRSLWCVLDNVTGCKLKLVCDRHDRHITVDSGDR